MRHLQHCSQLWSHQRYPAGAHCRRMRGPRAKGQTRAENLSGEIVGIRNLETIKVLDIRLQKSIENSFKLLPRMFNIRPGRTKCFYENFGSFMKFNCSRAGNNSMNYIALPSSFSIPISRRMKWNHNIILKSTISFLDNISAMPLQQMILYTKITLFKRKGIFLKIGVDGEDLLIFGDYGIISLKWLCWGHSLALASRAYDWGYRSAPSSQSVIHLHLQ